MLSGSSFCRGDSKSGSQASISNQAVRIRTMAKTATNKATVAAAKKKKAAGMRKKKAVSGKASPARAAALKEAALKTASAAASKKSSKAKTKSKQARSVMQVVDCVPPSPPAIKKKARVVSGRGTASTASTTEVTSTPTSKSKGKSSRTPDRSVTSDLRVGFDGMNVKSPGQSSTSAKKRKATSVASTGISPTSSSKVKSKKGDTKISATSGSKAKSKKGDTKSGVSEKNETATVATTPNKKMKRATRTSKKKQAVPGVAGAKKSRDTSKKSRDTSENSSSFNFFEPEGMRQYLIENTQLEDTDVRAMSCKELMQQMLVVDNMSHLALGLAYVKTCLKHKDLIPHDCRIEEELKAFKTKRSACAAMNKFISKLPDSLLDS